jgi:lipopolysaccharide/colanic/teichoic acid biosynthesis glycosyltransferase
MWDRVTSLVIAVVGLFVFAPLFGLIGLAIKIESPGSPLFFLQDRLDGRGRRFRLLKFRTTRLVRTHTGSESEWVTDPWNRSSSVGRVLRDFHLDELPQLINVLHGDMNLADLGWGLGWGSAKLLVMALVVLALFALLLW